jgi:hypothetical protein
MDCGAAMANAAKRVARRIEVRILKYPDWIDIKYRHAKYTLACR